MSVTNDIIFVTEIPLPNHDGIKDRHAALCFLPMLDGLNLEKVVLQLFREFNRGKKRVFLFSHEKCQNTQIYVPLTETRKIL